MDARLQQDDVTSSKKKRSSKARFFFWLHGVGFLVGLGLLIYVISRNGFESIATSVAKVGWGFFVIVGLNVARHLLRSATMYLAVDPTHRNFKYRSAVAARYGGEAVTFFSFAGPFLGDAAKAMLLRKNVSLTHGASAVIIDNILYYATVIIVMLAGIATLVLAYGSGGAAMNRVLTIIVATAIVLFLFILLVLRFQISPVSQIINFLAKRDLLPGFIARQQTHINEVEQNVFRFYHDRRRDFIIVFIISLSVHLVSVAEVYMALHFLGYDAFVSTAFIIESLTKVINAAFGFIPGTIGVYEGGNGLILKTLGYTTAIGVALALVRRGAILFSTAVGLIVLLWRTAERGAKQLRGPRS